MAEHSHQPVVELCKLLVDRFVWTATKMGREAFCAPFELSLVEETQARRQEGDDGCGLIRARGEGRRSPWLVVVFQKARQLVL
jgi:hypothetical protein